MEDIYEWQQFQPVKGRFTPYLTIVNTGGIGVSSGFVKKYNISEKRAVKMFFDVRKLSIGLAFLDEKAPDSIDFKVSKYGGAHINAKSFWTRFDIEHLKYAGKYTPKEITSSNNEKIFVIDLKEDPNYF